MNVLELAQEIGLDPKKVASTKGGEYKSSCPNCKAGIDRFCIWPFDGLKGRYWCRFCNFKGDAIQFCRDFLGLSYLEACKKVNVEPVQRAPSKYCNPFKKNDFKPHSPLPLSNDWKSRANEFINKCHEALLNNFLALNLLFERGVTIDTIRSSKLGWNQDTLYENRELWGLPLEIKMDGNLRRQWLPEGIIIPSFENEQPVRIKVRRSNWHKEDKLPKYVEISGSLQRPSVYGDLNKPIVVMESELDAILVQQEASSLCCCIALGGVSKRPDTHIHSQLLKSSLILLALDYDEAGKKEYLFWMSLYPNLRPWPVPKGKSPGDAFKLGVNLFNWLFPASGI